MSLIRVFNTNPQLRMMVYMEQSSFFLGRGEGVSRSVNIQLFRFHIEESSDPKLVVSLLILRRRLNGQVANVQLLRKYFARSFLKLRRQLPKNYWEMPKKSMTNSHAYTFKGTDNFDF